MTAPLHLLIIEDSGDDAQLMVRAIQQGGYDVQFERVETEAALRHALGSAEWDLVLCDYTLPSFNAIRALELVRASGKDLPFIIVSGSIGEEMAVAALRGGAHDFMLKGNLARLVPAIRRELAEAGTRRERRRAEMALRAAETRYRLLVERMPVITYVVSSEPPYKTLYISPQVEELLGFTPEEWRADPDLWEKQIHPDDHQRVLAEDQASRLEHRPFVAEYRLLSRDGRVVWLHDETHHVSEPGLVPFSQGIEFDITERKHAEQALQEAEAQYRTLVEQLPMVVYISPAQELGLNSYVSPQIKAMLGYTPQEWLATPDFWESAVHPDDHAAVMERIRQVNAAGGPFEMEYRVIARDGRVVWIRDEAVRVRDAVGAPSHWQGLMVDVTESKRRQRELEAIARASRALRQAQTVREILPRLLDETLSVLDTHQGSIWIRDPLGGEVRLAEQRQWGNALLRSHPNGHSIPAQVVETSQPVVVRELRTDPRVPEAHRLHLPPGVGGACVPLAAAGKTLGALFVNVRLPHEIDAEELRVLNALADLGASAIHRAQLFEETVKHLDRLAALRSIDIAISSSFDLRMVLNVVLDKVTSELGVDAADILLLRPDSPILEYAASKGFWTRAAASGSLSLADGLPVGVVMGWEITYIDDLRSRVNTLRRPALVTEEKFVSYYGVPLVAKGKVKGVLEIFHRSPIAHDLEWMQFLEALAGQTAIAIDSSSTFQDLQRTNLELALAYDATIAGWSHALDLRDRETEGHTVRVTEMALKLARLMGMPDEALTHLRRGGLLHDIGKMGVPDSILLKPGKLSEEEWDVMRRHPQFAFDMLASIAYLQPALDIPYCHHEKWDGTGYPRGLKGEQIPLASRIFAVVDVWDALSSVRPYRAAWKPEQVVEYLLEQSGKHFDPAAVGAFLELIRVGSADSSSP